MWPFGSAFGQGRHYVDAEASGTKDGSSWANAYDSLHLAFAAASAGDSIFVKGGGLFKPTGGIDADDGGATKRDSTFQISQRLYIYGGFAGRETGDAILAQRPTNFVKDTLSGDIGVAVTTLADFNDAGYADNSHHVVFVSSGGAGAVLDGFVVQGGNTLGGTTFQGAGVYMAGNATLAHLEVHGNIATSNGAPNGRGAGVYMTAGTLTHSEVHHNEADGLDGKGGGVYVFGSGRITHSAIYDNTTPGSRSEGGGVYLLGNGSLTHSKVYHNSAVESGGGVFINIFSGEAGAVTHSEIYGNSASFGGGLRMSAQSRVSHSHIHNNTTYEGTHSDARLQNGLTSHSGGGLYIQGGTLSHSAVYHNTANHGGGINIFAGTVLNVSLYGNTATDNDLSTDTEKGGGLLINGSAVVVANTLVYGNQLGSGSAGTAVYNEVASGAGATFVYNLVKGANRSAAIKGAVAHRIQVSNCIWATASPYASRRKDSAVFLRLKTNSQALDAGSDSRVPNLTDEKDLAGNARKSGTAVDMGAYEGAFEQEASLIGIAVSASTIDHGTAAGVEIATLSATHEGLGNEPNISYALQNANTDTDTFIVEGDKLKTNKAIDYATLGRRHRPITIVATHTPTGGAPLTYEKSLTLSIRPPTLTAIRLAGYLQLPDGAAVGTVLGTLLAQGERLPAGGKGIEYVIVTGDSPPSTFEIAGNQLRVLRAPVRAKKSTYSLQIKAVYAGVESALVTFTVSIGQGRHYVDAEASGTKDGSSWANAYDSLHLAFAAASAGDSIFVKGGGLFKPTGGIDADDGGATKRDSTFQISQRLYIYGGFAGRETGDAILAQRPTNFVKDTLSGDIGVAVTTLADFNDAGYADNSHHVVFVSSGGAGAVLDGFVVQGGNTLGGTTFQGAGVYMAGNATLAHLEVHGNIATSNGAPNGRGAGVYMTAGTLTHSEVHHNEADGLDGKGGGVYVFGSGRITHSAIYDNTTPGSRSEGGGVYLLGNGSLTHSKVYHNSAVESGGGVFINIFSGEAGAVTHSEIYGNSASFGGGLRMSAQSRVSHSHIHNNTTYEGTHSDARLQNGLTSHSGGGLYIQGGTLSHSAVYHNTANHGGGINIFAGTVLNVSLYGNTATDNDLSTDTEKGGGLLINGSAVVVANTLVYGNQLGSGSAGTAVYNEVASGAGATFVYNLVKGANRSAAIKGAVAHRIQVSNCIWATASPYASRRKDSAVFLRLKTNSQALDAGSDSRVPNLTDEKDLAGNARKSGTAVDMGAYEGAFEQEASLIGIAVSASTIDHGTAAGVEIATLSATHEGLGNEPNISYALQNANTDTDTFIVEGDKLKTNKAIDYATLGRRHRPITIVATHTPTGGTPLTYEKSLTFSIRPPTLTGIRLAGYLQVPDGAAVGTVLGTLSAQGTHLPASGEGIEYVLLGSSAQSTFGITGNQLKVLRSPVRAIKNIYSLQIKAIYAGVESVPALFTVSIQKVTITGIRLSGTKEVAEGATAGTKVGTLAAIGEGLPTDGAGISYAITDGNTPETFAIDEQALTIKNPPLRATKAVYDLSITAQYGAVTSSPVRFTITITANTSPLGTPYAATLQLYPNPTSDYAHLRGLPIGSRIRLLNAKGQIVLQNETNGHLNLSHLPTGIYLVEAALPSAVIRARLLKK